MDSDAVLLSGCLGREHSRKKLCHVGQDFCVINRISKLFFSISKQNLGDLYGGSKFLGSAPDQFSNNSYASLSFIC
jgi:hypothetical protein